MSGYLMNNFGDDMLFHIMCKLYPEVTFCILQDGTYARRIGSLRNLRCLGSVQPSRWNYAARAINKVTRKMGLCPASLRRRLRGQRFDAFVKLGGSIFMESRRGGPKYAIEEDRLLASHADASGVLDSNFGPYWTEGFKSTYDEHFKSFDFVSFRESHSAQLFEGMGSVSYGSDLIFALPEIGVSRIPHEGHRVAVVPIDLMHERSVDMTNCREGYEAELADLINRELDAGTEVALIAFCAREGDVRACQRIRARVGQPERVRVVGHVDVRETIAELASSDLIVASRFHAIFFGLALGIPVLPLSYSPKIDNEFEDLGCKKRFKRIPEINGPLEATDDRLLLPEDVDAGAVGSWTRQTDCFDRLLIKLGYGELARDQD